MNVIKEEWVNVILVWNFRMMNSRLCLRFACTVSSRESNVKASTTEDIVPKSALDPNQVPDDLEQAYVYHRTLIALHLLHFSKKFPSALKVYSAEKNVKWKKKGKKSTNPDEFPSRFFINLFKKLININASFL